jgi:hypothetical protein
MGVCVGWVRLGDLSAFERSYLDVDRHPASGRPWVLSNFVVSLDGSAAVGGRVGELSDPVDQSLFRLLRSLADVMRP